MKKPEWFTREMMKKRPGGSLIIRRFDDKTLTLTDIFNYGKNQSSEGYDVGYRDALSAEKDKGSKHD